MGNPRDTGGVVALVLDERAVLEQGIAQLHELLGSCWEIAPYSVNAEPSAPLVEDTDSDAVYSVRALNTSAPYSQVVVEAKTSLTPAAAKDVLLPRVRLLRRLYGQATVLVIAPWLSPRTRDVLAEHKVATWISRATSTSACRLVC